MKYIIDTANKEQINTVLSMGIDGITANPSMYKKEKEDFYTFLKDYTNKNLEFLSGEVMMDTVEDMLNEVARIQEINKDIVIKVNFSKVGLQLCSLLSKQGVKTAMTLVFTIPQAVAALQANVDYIFAFIGRNDEYGNDGLAFITSLQTIIKEKGYSTKIVAASIKNQHQLEEIAKSGIDYAAIPYDLYMKSLYHPLSESGADKFKEDWQIQLTEIRR